MATIQKKQYFCTKGSSRNKCVMKTPTWCLLCVTEITSFAYVNDFTKGSVREEVVKKDYTKTNHVTHHFYICKVHETNVNVGNKLPLRLAQQYRKFPRKNLFQNSILLQLSLLFSIR